MSDVVRVVARFLAHPEKADELGALLQGLLAPTHKEAGCRSYELLRCAEEPARFAFVEAWDTDAELDAHLASAHVQAAMKHLPDLLAEDAEIRRFRAIT